jgi:2-polyprenyl-3-methyl-5-hydroxy-6-metoxy-1,4-benzoquinol methylase
MMIPCYVCENLEFNNLLKAMPAMSSDGQTVDLVIDKEECKSCGTVRSSETSFLSDFYKKYYKLNVSNVDPKYVFEGKPMLKSAMHFEWIEKLVGSEIRVAANILEIGCGRGNLLNLFTVKNKFGVEPSSDAAIHANKIASVRNIGYEDILDDETYDIVLSTCVIEHTVDPNDFLKKNWNISHENSLIIIGAPIQDTESFDVYFLDHLHHFTSKQFIHLCQKNGFAVEKFEIGYKCMTTIAYFILRKKTLPADELKYEQNLNFQRSNIWINNLNHFLDTNNSKNLAAFGYGETSFFYQTYTKLNLCVNWFVDDVKAGSIKTVISCSDAIKQDLLKDGILILLANPHYHKFIKEKFAEVANLKFYSPFSNQFV